MLRCALRHPASSTFIYLAGSKARPGNEASADFEEHSGKRLRTEDWTPVEVETGRSLPASEAHHEGNRAHPGWTVWESDRGEGTDIINMKFKKDEWSSLIVIVMTIIFSVRNATCVIYRCVCARAERFTFDLQGYFDFYY